jgi:mycothiol synthase
MLLELTDQITLPEAPSIDGLTFRLFRDESDYRFVAELGNASSAADGVEDFVTFEWAKNYFTHLTGFDPYRDLLFAEVDGQPVANSRVWSRLLDDGTRLYMTTGNVLPQWRRLGLGHTLLRWAEGRLHEIAATQPAAGRRAFRSFTSDRETGTTAMLEQAGYRVVRYGFEMARSLAESIPDLSLPAGVEVRPVAPAQYRQLYAALNEAFRDHWGHSESTEEDYQRFVNGPHFQPQLWQVAWAGDEVAGMVLNFIDREYNEEFKRLRGWTDPICVRRPWRKQGLAKALIARSLHLLKEQGMTEAGLGVDADNPNGALRLYESLGYRQMMCFMTYEKPL